MDRTGNAFPMDPGKCRHKLTPALRERIPRIAAALELAGFKPRVVESYRSQARQRYLYTIGRRGFRGERIVTRTRVSKHTAGKAVDWCDRKTGYNDPGFFRALGRIARELGMIQVSGESCHVELP